MNKIYAGIGSREVTHEKMPEMHSLFVKIGKFLAEKGYVLRSGAAEGSDAAFEAGCDSVKGQKEIYVPWRGFNNCYHGIDWTQAGWKMAEQFHPNWENLKLGGRQMMARNSHQILGLDLKSPVDFVCCWTEGGLMKGGTAQALRIAEANKVKIFNFGEEKTLDKFRKWCKKNA
jgi:hypothetical protein